MAEMLKGFYSFSKGDLEKVSEKIKASENKDYLKNEKETFRTTIISAESDPRVSGPYLAVAPDIYFFDMLYDAYKNPNIQIKWRISREKYDVTKVKGFNVYRKKNKVYKSLDNYLNTIDAFDKISVGITKQGKFSSEKKAMQYLDKSLIPLESMNPNLSKLESEAKSRQLSTNEEYTSSNKRNISTHVPSSQVPTKMTSEDESVTKNIFEKLVFIDYSKNVALQKRKQVYVSEDDYVDFEYVDSKVGYGDKFIYCITTLLEDGRESNQSNQIDVEVNDLKPVDVPKYFKIYQIGENATRMHFIINTKDDVLWAFIFRMAEDEVSYKLVGKVKNNKNTTLGFTDKDLICGTNYKYRIFLQNIYGVYSSPTEANITINSQKVKGKSVTNNLKDPIMMALQDQNSDNIKIIVNFNDPRILYYELTRRNLTLYERDFTVPNNMGTYGVSWDQGNKIYPKKHKISPNREDTEASNPTTTITAEDSAKTADVSIAQKLEGVVSTSIDTDIATFIDNTITLNHIYQYRIIGFDSFRNKTSATLKTIRATGKKSVPEPINLVMDILNKSPLSIRVYWNIAGKDKRYAYIYDPEKNEYSLKEVDSTKPVQLENKVEKTSFLVQRRKTGGKDLNFPMLDDMTTNFVADSTGTDMRRK